VQNRPINPQMILATVLVFSLLGVLGAFPVSLIGLLAGGGTVGLNLLLLHAIVIGAWIPLKVIADLRIKGESGLSAIMPQKLSPTLIIAFIVGGVVLLPVLYVVSVAPLLIGLLGYTLTGQIGIAIIVALVYEAVNVARFAKREKESGGKLVNFSIFSAIQEMDLDELNQQARPVQEDDVIVIDGDDVQERDDSETHRLSDGDDDVQLVDDAPDNDRAQDVITVEIDPQADDDQQTKRDS
jgi:hypothetical protein